MKNVLLKLLLAGVLLMAGSAAAHAQGTPPDGGPEPDPTDVPIDGGASLLLAAGAAFGADQLRRRKAQR